LIFCPQQVLTQNRTYPAATPGFSMSVLIEFSMFPMDEGESVGAAVSKIVEMIANSAHPYRLTAMGTIVETEQLGTALELVERAYEVLAEGGSKRVYATIKLDIRAGRQQGLSGKIESIESRIGNVIT
jgi:uncharacterized protein (TIGR00106 family)